ncbi:hypothetical protein EV360DRAFT_74535 [Lentinula raphanica]|nr:hypothetical protein EV360DRAFT_74535 [Lentinula raphanica]
MYIAFGNASDRDRIEAREIGPAAPAVAPSPDYFYTLCLKLGPHVLVRRYVEIRTAFASFEFSFKGQIYAFTQEKICKRTSVPKLFPQPPSFTPPNNYRSSKSLPPSKNIAQRWFVDNSRIIFRIPLLLVKTVAFTSTGCQLDIPPVPPIDSNHSLSFHRTYLHTTLPFFSRKPLAGLPHSSSHPFAPRHSEMRFRVVYTLSATVLFCVVSVTTSPLPPALRPTLVPRAPSDQPGAPAENAKKPRDQRVKLWTGNYDDSDQPLPLSAPLEQRKKANPAICYASYFCLFFGKDGTVHLVDMNKPSRKGLPPQEYYVELPALLSNVFRRPYEQEKALATMMNVDKLLEETNTCKEALNQKSYILTTVKLIRKFLLPYPSEAAFENKVLPKIAHVVDLLESENPIESISAWQSAEAAAAAESMDEV